MCEVTKYILDSEKTDFSKEIEDCIRMKDNNITLQNFISYFQATDEAICNRNSKNWIIYALVNDSTKIAKWLILYYNFKFTSYILYYLASGCLFKFILCRCSSIDPDDVVYNVIRLGDISLIRYIEVYGRFITIKERYKNLIDNSQYFETNEYKHKFRLKLYRRLMDCISISK